MSELRDDREWLDARPAVLVSDGTAAQAERRVGTAVLREVYGWMCAGLALSGAVAWHVAQSGLGIKIIANGWMFGLAIAEIGLVLALSFCINKMSAAVASAVFLAYAALNGLTLSTVFMAFSIGSIARTFCITAGMFGGMAVYGSVTGRDLSGWGSFLVMGLFGVVIAGLANLFFKSAMVDFLVSVAGVIVFTGLAAWDAQKVRRFAVAAAERGLPAESTRKMSVMCALSLYLDFINLFLYLLRFTGGNRK
jgi:hypothetical protein